jgi:hypothetical protein
MEKIAVEEIEGELSEQELQMGKDLGMFDETEPKEVEKETEASNDDETVSQNTDVVEGKKDAIAEEDLSPEKEEAIVKDFNANEKKLYWERKKERIKRQEAQREKELTAIQLSAAKREIELLKTGQPKSVEDSQEAKEQEVDEDDERIMTVGEFKRMQKSKADEAEKVNAQAQSIIKRVEVQEVEAKAKYADYDEVTKLAAEMIKTNKSYARVLAQAANDPDENVAEVAYNIGRLHPKYGKTAKAEPKAETKQIDRAIKNSEKRVTSASVAGGGGKSAVGEADLSVEDVAKMSNVEYGKLSKETRDRILRESCGL